MKVEVVELEICEVGHVVREVRTGRMAEVVALPCGHEGLSFFRFCPRCGKPAA